MVKKLLLLELKNLIYNNDKTNSTIMKRDTYYILNFLIIGLALIGGRYLGLSFIERVIAASVVGGLFQLVYRKQLKK